MTKLNSFLLILRCLKSFLTWNKKTYPVALRTLLTVLFETVSSTLRRILRKNFFLTVSILGIHVGSCVDLVHLNILGVLCYNVVYSKAGDFQVFCQHTDRLVQCIVCGANCSTSPSVSFLDLVFSCVRNTFCVSSSSFL